MDTFSINTTTVQAAPVHFHYETLQHTVTVTQTQQCILSAYMQVHLQYKQTAHDPTVVSLKVQVYST